MATDDTPTEAPGSALAMGKPTIRELLDQLMSDFIGRSLAAPALAERVEAVLKLHPKHGPGCGVCMVVWPCPTIRALNGEA